MRMGLRWQVLSLVAGLVILGLALGVSPAKAQAKKSTKHTSTRHHSSARSSHTGHARTASLKKRRYYPRSRRIRGQQAPTAERISEIQTALAKDGSYAGSPSGKWDSATVEAMKKFQAGHGLSPTGKLDALTLQRLGLGSSTAGVAAPYPPATPSEAVSSSSAADDTRRE